MTTENYVYKKEVDWSLLQEGFHHEPKVRNYLYADKIN